MANSPRKANHERLEENLLMYIQFKHQDLHFPVRVFILSSNPVRFRLRLHLTANVPTLQDLFSRKHRFPFFAKVARSLRPRYEAFRTWRSSRYRSAR